MVTRKVFLTQLTGGGAALLLGACGGGSDSAPPPAVCNQFAFTANHGHTLLIPQADLDSTIDKVYSIQGSATHDHLITLTRAQLAQLKAGQAVQVTTDSGGAPAHTHDMTGTCA